MGIVDDLETAANALQRAATTDIDALPLDLLHEHLIASVRLGHQISAVTARLAARWDDTGVWAFDGSKSARIRLARDANTSPVAAGRLLRRARRLADMPATAEALSAGDISPDHVDLLARGRSRRRFELFERDEKLLVDDAKHLRFAETTNVVDYWCRRADAELGDDGNPPEHEPTLSVTAGVGGETRVDGHLDPIGGAEFAAMLGRIVDELSAVDKQAGTTRGRGRLRADALVEMARRAAATPQGARRPRPLITIVTGDESFRRLCELSNGNIVAPAAMVPYLTECDIETMMFDGPFLAIGKSPQRTFTGALRRAIQVRDRHCQEPCGCDEPIDRCDIDHLTAWADGGQTEQTNGRLRCRCHNRIPRPPRGPDPPDSHPAPDG